jgi:branched-chain amino acid transport system substrate-binding protein
VPPLYSKLLDVDKVDLVVSGYGTAVVAPAMPLVMQRNLMFMTLFGLNVNSKFDYDRYFAIIPAGPRPAMGWTAGFFEAARSISPKPTTIAIVGSDAEYPHMALDAAREHARDMGLKVVYDKTFPPTTTDYAPVLRAVQATNPDVIFVATYPPESVGVVRAANEIGLKAKLFGGGMIGTQYVAIKTQLGPLLNGLVSVETFAPEMIDKVPSVAQFLVKYQARAVKEGVDPLGYYLPPYAYAAMQIVEQAVKAVGSLDQGKLAEYMHKASFDTVVGNVSFAKNGEWTSSRVLYVQYNGVTGNGVEEWRKAGHETVLFPPDYKTGNLQVPYEGGKK